MLETNFDNWDLELCLNCDICEASDTFYWDNFSDARSQGKAQGRKAKKVGAEWEHSCPECDFDNKY